MQWFVLFTIIVAIIYWAFTKKTTSIINQVSIESIVDLLEREVNFYRQIVGQESKRIFAKRVTHFIETTRFTDVGNAKHELLDEVLIATSALIPLYAFPEWEYHNINEILLYDDHFDAKFQVGSQKNISGMVGDGFMNNTMALSLVALREGFTAKDGDNTALHEFIHLIDNADGSMDGVPEYLIPKHLVTPWLQLIRGMIQEIRQGETQLDGYGGTNEIEFFAVVSEYFFEKPILLQSQHPVLYAMMQKIFSAKGNP
jgi:hypothetical protein